MILAVILIPISLNLIVVGDCQSPSPGENALHVWMSDASEYGYASRTIQSILVNNSVIEFKARVNILRFQSSPVGIPLQIDFYGRSEGSQNEQLRFSFRFGNDGSVIFYYPFMNSSAAVTVRRAWGAGEWVSVSTVVSGNSSRFYLNGELMMQNDREHPARSAGLILSRIGFGKTDKQKLSVEGFLADIQLATDQNVKFSENFSSGLGSYEIKKTQNTLLHIIDPFKYASLEASSPQRSVSSGDTLLLQAHLLDSGLGGIGNSSVAFEYQSGDQWSRMVETRTLDNGTAKSSWRVPSDFRGAILIRARYPGDFRFTEATSLPFTVNVTTQTNLSFGNTEFIISAYAFGLVAAILLGRKYGFSRVFMILLPVLSSIIFLFSLSVLTHAIELKAFIGYTPRTVKVQFLGTQIDETIWILSLVTLAGAWVLFQIRRLSNDRVVLVPVLSIVISLLFRIQGMNSTSAVLAMISAAMIPCLPLLRDACCKPWRPEEIALRFMASILTMLFVIEAGSAVGWVYNILDPHVPFDGEIRWLIPSIEANLFGVLYPVTLPALVILMFSWVLMQFPFSLSRRFMTIIARNSAPAESQVDNPSLKESSYNPSRSAYRNYIRPMSRQRSRYLLYLTMPAIVCCSLLLVYYPYFYATRLIGVDTPWYYQNLVAMSRSGWLSHLLSGYGAATRMPYLLLLYAIMKVTSFSPEFVVRIGPAIPASLLGATSFLFIRTITRDDILAVFSGFLALFSMATTVGIYAGVFANWLALGLTTFFFTLIIRMWLHPTPIRSLSSILCGLAILVTHAWTGAVTLASLGISALLGLANRLLTRRRLPDNALRSSLAVVGANLALVLLLLVSAGALTGEIVRISTEGIASISASNVSTFPVSLSFTFQYYVGGFFANSILILLSIIGAVTARRLNAQFSSILASMLLITSVPLLFVGSWWQWRLLYDIPYHILAVFGFYAISNRIATSQCTSVKFCNVLLAVTILLASFNYSLRCLNYIPS